MKSDLLGFFFMLINVLLAFEYVFFLNLIDAYLFRTRRRSICFPIALIVVFALFSLLPGNACKMKFVISLIPLIIVSLVVGLSYVLHTGFRKYCDYKTIRCDSEKIFSEKKVMIIVPHEDDDMCLVGGMVEKYIENGSEIFTVFVTNGDYDDIGETRINEAIACWKYLGVPEQNIIFLGYGDRWSTEAPHIYNAAADEVVKSAVGRTETYGTDSHPAYHNGTSYTFNHCSHDLKQLILEKRPDVLFICDYDSHPDHKAVSLFSEYVLGKILQASSDYQPIVYKGYAYSTAWFAIDDYRSLNLKSTLMPKEAEFEPMVYDWNDRVRLPVDGNSLSRSLISTKTYKALAFYHSQDARFRAGRIINSDKVFWQRRTDSLLYNSNIMVSSGDGSFLTDFKILENADVNFRQHYPYDGIWIPDKNDEEKTIHIILEKETDIAVIYLYDHPSPDENITNIRIMFSDGSGMDTGKLNTNGSATKITVNKKKITYFDIKIISFEGDNPGLSEVEAFREREQYDDTFLKIMDNEGNFVYDYFAEHDTTGFMVYSNNPLPNLTDSRYAVVCNNDNCSCTIQNNQMVVTCPKGESCTVELLELSSGLSDKINVTNPGALGKAAIKLIQKIESDYLYFAAKENYRHLFWYRFFFRGSSVRGFIKRNIRVRI